MSQDSLPSLTNWMPLEPQEIQRLLGTFDRWCLCGGKSIDVLVGRNSREHGDTDIGVFRSDLVTCLSAIGRRRVFLCVGGKHDAWDGDSLLDTINDIWITDVHRELWILQIVVFTDDDRFVYYKRNRSIRWPKESHSWRVNGLNILNPLITLLYKANQLQLADKDTADIRLIIQELKLFSSNLKTD
jgi:hypothetical protein